MKQVTLKKKRLLINQRICCDSTFVLLIRNVTSTDRKEYTFEFMIDKYQTDGCEDW